MRRDKPWFRPMPSIGKMIVPVSWQGYVLTIALLLGMALLKVYVHDVVRAAIAFWLMIAAYLAIAYLTWSKDPA